jgi:hypothetical protein
MRPSAVLLAVMIAGGALWLVGMGLGHGRAKHFRADEGGGATRTPGGSSSASASDPKSDEDDDDDPSQVDTIVLGDAGDAPVPAKKGQRISNVHATVIVHLPRFGQQSGLIPDSPAGHLLYRWLAAFNQASESALADALPNDAAGATAAAQMELRKQTGGFNLLSAKEVAPGLLVFRLRDQTPDAREVLGTLFVRPKSEPAAVGNFSLRMVEVKKAPAPKPE